MRRRSLVKLKPPTVTPTTPARSTACALKSWTAVRRPPPKNAAKNNTRQHRPGRRFRVQSKQYMQVRRHNDTKFLIKMCNCLVAEAIVLGNRY
jgi:hypothetical protein